ncbi:MAG: hypothetical protein HKN07_01335 [Acidimicrobiia bacterium]|nr:hypothetical protein [Acidimicrobiia bacterium]
MSKETIDLAGVLIWTSADHFPAMATFYTDIMELPTRSQRDGFINFEWGEMRLTVATHDAVVGHSSEPLRMMVNFAVHDIVKVHARLVHRGVAFSRDPERESWGVVATFEDPDGNVLQLLQLDVRK